jgi:hypothetical protein
VRLNFGLATITVAAGLIAEAATEAAIAENFREFLL